MQPAWSDYPGYIQALKREAIRSYYNIFNTLLTETQAAKIQQLREKPKPKLSLLLVPCHHKQ